MKIAIVVVARDSEIIEFFEKRRAAVIPKSISSGNDRFNLVVIDARCDDDELMHSLIKMHANHDAVGILIETDEDSRLNGCTSAVFRRTFSSADAKSKNSLQNYFASSLIRWLKNLVFLSKKFTEGKNRKCLMLPQHSFIASDLSAIFQLCRAVNHEGRFTQLLEEQLTLIRGRSNPKKHQHDKNRNEYLVDDLSKHFELGKDRHGQAETGRPPHNFECEFTAWARFGMTMDRLIHYNVSLSGSMISGNFQDCHGNAIYQKPCKNINMFPNGFIR